MTALYYVMIIGCKKLGISHDGCSIVDESDGTVIDDDETLLELKNKTFILLESTDEWTPAKQSTSHQAKSIDVDSAISHHKAEVKPRNPLKKQVCRIKADSSSKTVDFFEFMSELPSTNCFDLEHLTAVACTLVSLNISEHQWNSLWANQTFLDFINNCAEHTPAKMHVVSWLKEDETAQKCAPEHILVKFYITHDGSGTNIKLPKQLNSLCEIKEWLQHIVDDGDVPQQFMNVLETSVRGNAQLEREISAAEALLYWSSASRTFHSSWNIDTVKHALANINEYVHSESIQNSDNLHITNKAETKELSETDMCSTSQQNTYVDNLAEDFDSDEKTTKVGPQRPTRTKGRRKMQHQTDSESQSSSGAFDKCTVTLLLNGQTFNITQMEYYRISEILPKPEVDEAKLTGFVGNVLPYILQRVKMRGCCVLQPNRISALVHRHVMPDSVPKRSNPFATKKIRSNTDSKQYACPVSRLDCLTCLLGTVESIVARDLLLVMSQFPVALPLIMHNIAEDGKCSLMSSLLRGAVIKWESRNGKIVEHSLFNDPFKLLVAVRLGQNSVGKSTILNQLLAKENTFSTKGEPGSHYGKPATVAGSVEFIWLTQETCKDTFWKPFVSQYYNEDNTITLLANLHGDANENVEIITLLSHFFQCRYLAFIMPRCGKDQWMNFLSYIPSEDHVSTIRVDPEDYDVTESGDIETSRITEDATLYKVRSCIDEGLKRCTITYCVSANKQCFHVSLADGIETELSQKIIDLVASSSCKSTKSYLRLQMSRQDMRNIDGRLSCQHDVVKQFVRILQSPPDVMQQAVVHLEHELSRLCNAETQKVRLNLSQLKADFKKAMVNSHTNPKEIESIRQKIADTLNVMDSMNLGLEHFFREVGHLYKLQQHQFMSLMVPQNVGNLFLNGHPIELLDGDAGQIQTLWLNAIFKHVNAKHPKLRVYVISIIGLQSSGKSTLLNSLFACRFAVSVGRCSRGLFMRLLFLDKKIASTCKIDAILLIDSEGLGSPEKMGDVEGEKKDRLLATFAMGISNLAIINVLGEYMKELTEILQIAVVTMTRLEKAEIAPDILMVQHLLSEKNSEKLSQSEETFCEAIRKAIDLAEKKDVEVGVRNAKCLHELFTRIQNGTLLTQFHPYKDGATANAPASEAYHDDVVDFYQKILSCCRSSKTVIEFNNWKTLLESYWECVTQEDFALRFKNVKEIHDFIDRGQRIADVKQAIDAAFSAHAKKYRARSVMNIRGLLIERNSMQSRQDYLKDLENQVNCIPNGCAIAGSEKCAPCKEACEKQKSLHEYVHDRPYENETLITITEFIKTVRKSTMTKLSQSFDAVTMQQGCCAEFETIITNETKRYLRSQDAGEFSAIKCTQIMNEIFGKLEETARAKHQDIPVRYKIAEAIVYEYPQYSDIIDRFNREIKKIEDIFPKKQKQSEVDYLKSVIDSVLRSMLQKRQADCYEEGMVGELSRKLTRELDLCVREKKIKLNEEQKLSIQVWTLQSFCKRMEAMQADWDKKNKPLSILHENKYQYNQTIKSRLQHGFNGAAEGQIIGQHLLKVTQQKAIDAENTENIKSVKSIVWITNSEKVRLKYMKHLADEVRRKQKNAAVAYFLDPTKEIEEWYKAAVDEYRSESLGTTFKETFEQEFQLVLRKIKNASDSNQIVEIAQSANMETLYYQPSCDANGYDVNVMKDKIVETMDVNKEQFSDFDKSLLSHPSADAGVMSLLGCTRRCFWCGAMCWGQRGHEGDKGETRKHHSSHQPQGLLGTHHRYTKHLLSQPCHNMKDETKVHFGEYLDTGILWLEAKEKHFSDWKFDKHYNSKFDELMRWFFYELHHDIAKTSETLKHATNEDLEENNCTNLQYDDIMSRIEQEIN